MPSQQQWIFAKRPFAEVTNEQFKLESIPEESIDGPGQLLLSPLYVSVDPYMRGRMSDVKSYIPAFEVGKPLQGGVVAKVLESTAEGFNKGDLVVGMLPWKTKMVVKDNTIKSLNKIPQLPGVSPSLFVGALGITGLSAYFPLKYLVELKKGQTVFVSGAAGAVGSIAGQIAKSKGCLVYGSAGSDEKVKFLKSIGFDDAFNYRTHSAAEGLTKVCPQGFDVFFDNVGGELLDEMFLHMKDYGTIINCGAISEYNTPPEKRRGLKNYIMIIKSKLTLRGFIVSDWMSEMSEGTQELVAFFLKGSLQSKETFVEGFENIPHAFMGLFKGSNTGKMVVKIKSTL